jgi:hypothetical protein
MRLEDEGVPARRGEMAVFHDRSFFNNTESGRITVRFFLPSYPSASAVPMWVPFDASQSFQGVMLWGRVNKAIHI